MYRSVDENTKLLDYNDSEDKPIIDDDDDGIVEVPAPQYPLSMPQECQGKCPLLDSMENAESEWEESRVELSSRLKLGSKWEKPKQYSEWQSRLTIKELARAYLRYRLPLHIIEYRLTLVAMRLQERIRIASTASGSLLIAFLPGNYKQYQSQESSVNSYNNSRDLGHCELIYVPFTEMNLSKMVDVEKISDGVVNGDCIFYALPNLRDVRLRPSTPWPDYMYIPACMGMALVYSPLFNGAGVWELCASLIISFISSAVEHYVTLFNRLGIGKEMMLAFICSVVACLFDRLVKPINIMNATFAGLVFHLPGLAITTAVTNICFGNTSIGAGGFMEVLIVSANLGIGVLGGLGVIGRAFETTLSPGSDPLIPLPPWTQHIAICLAVFPTTILFKGKLKHMPFYAVGTLCGFYGTLLATTYLGTGSFSTAFGATLTGLVANFYGRFLKFGPGIELLLLSIIAIVPGGFSLQFTTAGDASTATMLLTDMVLVALGIVTGQFVSCMIIPPKRQL